MKRAYRDYDDNPDDVDELDDPRWVPIQRRRPAATPRREKGKARGSELRAARRPETESFRCKHCQAMVGPTVSGGRHRNHCPFCLYSRHVDDVKPGDRASACRAKMAPIGLYTRPSGDLVIIHRCLGCGFERHNRVAADDNPVALEALPLLDPGVGEESWELN